MKYFFFDCEFGGLDPEMSLLTLHGKILNKDLQEIDSISLYMKPDDGKYNIEIQAMKVNKINLLEHDEVAIPISEAKKQFYHFLWQHSVDEKLIAAGHNLSLDIRFVKKHLLNEEESPERNCWARFFSHRTLDTASIAQILILAGLLPEYTDSLQTMAEYFNFDYSGAHDAKFDTELTIKVLHEQLRLITKKGL